MSALFARLLDDAALFPPQHAPMDEALSAHRAASHAGSSRADASPLVGRFLCPASRFAELRTHLVPEDLLDLGVVADTGVEELPQALDAVRAEPRVRPSSVEIALPRDADQARAAAVMIARLPSGVPTHIEVHRAAGWLHALDRIAAARSVSAEQAAAEQTATEPTATGSMTADGPTLGAKYRVEGLRAADVPGTDALAAFITACAQRDLPFICAGGPGHAVRNASGHGLLNVLLATACAAAGAPEHDVRHALERTDASGIVRDLRSLPAPEARATRGLLVAFGAPDVRAARRDLAAAGLIKRPDTGEDRSS